MEVNKDEALRCLKIARKEYMEGNIEKALRFVKKSLKLFPTEKGTKMLEQFLASTENGKPTMNGNHTYSNGTVNNSSGMNENNIKPEMTRNYTSEQKSLVDQINNYKDYYKILGVSNDCTEAELKKAYRKMALQLHPDKNLAPGATEAFKAVGKAFSVLSDSEKRDRYDRYGDDGSNNLSRARRDSTDDEYEQTEFDPQELFNMFFGGGYPSGNVRTFRRGHTYYYQRPQRAHHHHHQDGNDINDLVRYAPILIFLVITVLGSFLSMDPSYSLMRIGEFSHPRSTKSFGISYYVKSDFSKKYPASSTALRKLEERVVSDYVDYLRESCYDEKIRKEQLRRKGVFYRDSSMLKRSEEMTTPSCGQLDEMFRRR